MSTDLCYDHLVRVTGMCLILLTTVPICTSGSSTSAASCVVQMAPTVIVAR